MMDEYCKCRFCKSYDEYEGCEWRCNNYEDYTPIKDRIIKFVREKGIGVSDAIALINM